MYTREYRNIGIYIKTVFDCVVKVLSIPGKKLKFYNRKDNAKLKRRIVLLILKLATPLVEPSVSERRNIFVQPEYLVG